MTTIDFSKALADAKSASFEAMPDGNYNIEVVKAEAVTASTGRPMIKCKMKVIDGPYQNRPVMTQFVLVIDNPNALAMFFRNMKGFGLDENFFAQLGSGQLEPVAAALVSRRAQVTLGTRKWNGEDRNEVTGIKPYTGAPGTMTGTPGVPGATGVSGTPAPGLPRMPGLPPTTGPQAQPQLPPPAPALTPPPAAQLPPQASQVAQAPVAPSAVQAPVQAPPAPIRQADPGSTAATVSDLVVQQTAEAAAQADFIPPKTPETNVIPTAADTAPPAYAAQPVTQYVDSSAQSLPTPPPPPI